MSARRASSGDDEEEGDERRDACGDDGNVGFGDGEEDAGHEGV